MLATLTADDIIKIINALAGAAAAILVVIYGNKNSKKHDLTNHRLGILLGVAQGRRKTDSSLNPINPTLNPNGVPLAPPAPTTNVIIPPTPSTLGTP